MTICNSKKLDLKAQKGKKIEISFDGGDITSDGGVLLLQKADERLDLLRQWRRGLKILGDRQAVNTACFTCSDKGYSGLGLATGT